MDSESARSCCPVLPSEAEEAARRGESPPSPRVLKGPTGQLTSLWYQTCCCCAPRIDFLRRITPDDMVELSQMLYFK